MFDSPEITAALSSLVTAVILGFVRFFEKRAIRKDKEE